MPEMFARVTTAPPVYSGGFASLYVGAVYELAAAVSSTCDDPSSVTCDGSQNWVSGADWSPSRATTRQHGDSTLPVKSSPKIRFASGVFAPDWDDSGDDPELLAAWTGNVYAVELVRPVMVAWCVLPFTTP